VTGIPDRPRLEGLEEKWSDRWEAGGLYRSAGYDEVAAFNNEPGWINGLKVADPLIAGHVLLGVLTSSP